MKHDDRIMPPTRTKSRGVVSSEERIGRVELGVWNCLRQNTFQSQEQRQELQPTPRNSISTDTYHHSVKSAQLYKSCPNISEVLPKQRHRSSFAVWEIKLYCLHCLGVRAFLVHRWCCHITDSETVGDRIGSGPNGRQVNCSFGFLGFALQNIDSLVKLP